MATTQATGASLATRRATVRQLAADGMSNRAIARHLGIHHRTVARDLDATPAPTVAETPAPPAPNSGAQPAPRLLHPLAPALIQDLNMLVDRRTGALPEPLQSAIRAAADQRRAAWRTALQRHAAEAEQAETGRAPVRAHVAP